MRSVTIAVLLATAVIAATANPLDFVDDLIASPSSPESSASVTPPPAPVKLDKNLRRALLKALSDLEAESAEQQQSPSSTDRTSSSKLEDDPSTNSSTLDVAKYDFLEISRQKSAIFSFDGLSAEEDIPSEDKLQNSSFVETDKYALSDNPKKIELNKVHQPPKDYTKGVQVHHVVPSEKTSGIYETKPTEQLESVESRNIASTVSTSAVSEIQKNATLAPIAETLSVSASSNLASAAANSLVPPKPTVSTPSAIDVAATGKSLDKGDSKIVQVTGKESKADEVKIFQAPLVAAFTVQQDERGVPKSVVPLFKNNVADSQSQPLSLQEQLEFKQRLLEKQLAQLQARQAQQTQFLLRQRQAYEEQLRQRQQHEFYLQEQRRLKQLQEQEQQQRLLQQQQQQQQQRFQQQQSFHVTPAQRLPQQLSFQQQQQTLDLVPPQPQFQQQTSFKSPNVHLQPSLNLEVPGALLAPAFQNQQPLLRAPLQQQQPPPPPFQPFPVEFQQPPAPTPLARFNRQEAFGSVGNFGFNNFQSNDKSKNNVVAGNALRNTGSFAQQRPQFQNNNLAFNSFRQQQQQQQQLQQQQQQQLQRPFSQAATPARQIQDLLYQSGIAGDLQGAGSRNQEDLNIVSKVLALNVGALPANNGHRASVFHQQQH